MFKALLFMLQLLNICVCLCDIYVYRI